MKRKDSDIEIYRSAIAALQQEKADYAARCETLRNEMRAMSESYREETRALRETYEEKMDTMRRSYEEKMDELRKSHEDSMAELETTMKTLKLTVDSQSDSIKSLTQMNASLMKSLDNAVAAGRLSRGKRFAPTTEQRNLLNNRRADRRAEEKDGFDGTPPAPLSGGETVSQPTPRRKKKSAGRKPAVEDYGCDETVVHRLESYFSLPDGAVFKTRNGDIETHEYESYEYIPGRVIRHVWQTATYVDHMGDARNTLPRAARENPVAGCPFSPEMLAFILSEKYAYHTPKNRIKRKLREMGARFSKSTFIRYYQLSEKALRDMLEPVFRKAVTDCDYLMIDETCELVGVVDPETRLAQYLKKYLWAFHNKASGLVWYLYEHGSRAREVVKKVLEGFKGAFTTDGYAAYKAFGDTAEYPDLVHCGCWAHPRRLFIEAIGVASEVCYGFIDEIEQLFANDRLLKGLTEKERAEKRRRISLPVFNRILAMAKRVATDAGLMGRDLLKKAVNYIINQSDTLRNAILDGKAELSNNLCEQRMKPIKLSLKNCQNIGSEDAAENAAFMHSLVESCRLNSRNPYDYLCDLFRKMRSGLDDVGKRVLLPDRWAPEC